MTTLTARTRALNSLIFVHDFNAVDSPEIDGAGLCWFTPTIVAVSCLPDCDGETQIQVGELNEVSPLNTLAFDGYLKTPNRHILLTGVVGNKILEFRVPHILTKIRIWTTGAQDTDRIVIGMG